MDTIIASSADPSKPPIVQETNICVTGSAGRFALGPALLGLGTISCEQARGVEMASPQRIGFASGAAAAARDARDTGQWLDLPRARAARAEGANHRVMLAFDKALRGF